MIEGFGLLPATRLVRMGVEQASQSAVRGIALRAPKGQFLAVERGEVVPSRGPYRVMVRSVGLDEDLSTQVTPPGAPRYLGEQLKRPFSGTEIGQVQRRICTDDSDHGYSW